MVLRPITLLKYVVEKYFAENGVQLDESAAEIKALEGNFGTRYAYEFTFPHGSGKIVLRMYYNYNSQTVFIPFRKAAVGDAEHQVYFATGILKQEEIVPPHAVAARKEEIDHPVAVASPFSSSHVATPIRFRPRSRL